MVSMILDFLCRLLVTLIILVPALTAIVVACTIIYDKDFRKNKPPTDQKEEEESPPENNENKDNNE